MCIYIVLDGIIRFQHCDDDCDYVLKYIIQTFFKIYFSLLTGNIIKAILLDFENIKRTMYSRSLASTSTFREKVAQDISAMAFDGEFPTEILTIKRKLRKVMTSEEENTIENQVQFLKFLIKLKEMIANAEAVKRRTARRRIDDSESAENNCDEEIEIMKSELKDLLYWVMTRDRYSEQELVDFNEELYRAWLMFSYLTLSFEIKRSRIRLSADESKYMAYIKENLGSGSKLGKLGACW